MKELVVNGKYYPMWSGLIDGKKRYVRIVNIDAGNVGVAKLLDIRLEPSGKDNAFLTFDVEYKGKRDEWGSTVDWIGIVGNDTTYKGLCLDATYTGKFILQSKEDVV